MNPQSVRDLVSSVGVCRGAFYLLEICSEDGVSLDGDLVVPVCSRVFDEQRAGRHDALAVLSRFGEFCSLIVMIRMSRADVV